MSSYHQWDLTPGTSKSAGWLWDSQRVRGNGVLNLEKTARQTARRDTVQKQQLEDPLKYLGGRFVHSSQSMCRTGRDLYETSPRTKERQVPFPSPTPSLSLWTCPSDMPWARTHPKWYHKPGSVQAAPLGARSTAKRLLHQGKGRITTRTRPTAAPAMGWGQTSGLTAGLATSKNFAGKL